VAERVGIWSTN